MSPRLVLVTDPAFGDPVIERCVREAGRALPSGWLCVQLRDKARATASLRHFAASLRRITREVGALFVVNGDERVARDVEADGVHLGGDSLARGASVYHARTLCGAGAWVSMAAHSDEDVRSAVAAGADAVLVSPIFSTRPPSPRGEPLPIEKNGRGLDALRGARAIAGAEMAIFALGGVTPARARSCVRSGASGVAVMRALLASAEPGRTARAFHDAVAAGC